MSAAQGLLGILAVAVFVFVQAGRMATSGEPIGPAFDEQTTARTHRAIGWPIGLAFLAAILGLAFL